MNKISYSGYRFPPEIIQQAIWFYLRFTLSLRDVAHIRAALTAASLSIPLIDGRLALGTWQGVYLFEHRRAPHRREIAVHALGE